MTASGPDLEVLSLLPSPLVRAIALVSVHISIITTSDRTDATEGQGHLEEHTREMGEDGRTTFLTLTSNL